MRKGGSGPLFHFPRPSSPSTVATHLLDTPLPHDLPVVLDTNVVLSLWMFEDPSLIPLRTAVESGRLQAFSRADCLGELTRVLAYPHFAQPAERQAAIAAAYRARCRLVEPATDPAYLLPACPDRDDQKFLEVARDSAARILVTRDKLVIKLARRPVVSAHFAILPPERLQALLR